MKCDKLLVREIYVDCLGKSIIYYDPYEVNEAIQELKVENKSLKDKLDAANKQCENLINSATEIMILQDKVNASKCNELETLKVELERFKKC